MHDFREMLKDIKSTGLSEAGGHVKFTLSASDKKALDGLSESARVMVHVTGKPTKAEEKEVMRLVSYYKGEHEDNTDKGAIFSFEDEIDAKLFAEMVNGRSSKIRGLGADVMR